MAAMRKHEEQSRNVLSVIGVNAEASEYASYAEQQDQAANRWRKGAVIAYTAAAVVFFAAILIPMLPGVDIEQGWWESLIQKLGAPGGAAAIGYFLQRESAQHRREARTAKEIELTLTALEPFIANLHDDEQRAIRLATASKVFVSGQKVTVATPRDVETSGAG
ncbi:hypothetical protein A7J15_07210 [Microbacterium sediminis]|uniref:Uncharacterized protein n=2 Tax=Microbacterium sediminis TaxID=904291 RepID=A0A1B9NA59_9MICO|nr:hypothetical protein A7J15_07210 [Microbacterium sediminis]